MTHRRKKVRAADLHRILEAKKRSGAAGPHADQDRRKDSRAQRRAARREARKAMTDAGE